MIKIEFKDVKKKIKLYKEEIIKDIISTGKYPSSEDIKARLYDIDPFLPIFNKTRVYPGDKLNVKELNRDYESIYKDLSIIYQILEELVVIEIEELKSYINTHISSLENEVSSFKKRAEAEINSTLLGDTLLNKTSNFEIVKEPGKKIVKLGEVGIRKGSSVSFIVNASNIEAEKCRCVLQDNDDRYIASPYNYNQESIIIESDLKPNRYNISIEDLSKISTPFELKIPKMSRESKYITLTQRDKAKVTERSGTHFYSLIDGFVAGDNCTIEFIVVGGKFAEFTFNKPPVEANFNLENRFVDNLKYYHLFRLKLEEGTFIRFSSPNGEIFGEKQDALVRNDKIYYTGNSSVREFFIDEHDYSQRKNYYAYLEILNDDKEKIDIENVLIKEMFSF